MLLFKSIKTGKTKKVDELQKYISQMEWEMDQIKEEMHSLGVCDQQEQNYSPPKPFLWGKRPPPNRITGAHQISKHEMTPRKQANDQPEEATMPFDM